MEPETHTIIEGTLAEINAKLAEQAQAEPPAAQDTNTPPADTPPPPAETPAPEHTPADTFDRTRFLSETFGQEFKSDEDFTQWKSTITEKATKFDDLQKQYEQAQNELKAVDPLKFFASKEKYIENQLLIKYPDLDPAIVSRVLTTDIEKLDPVSTIAFKELMKDSKKEVFATDEEAYNYVCKKLGYDRDLPFDEQESDVKVAVRAAAKEARGEFNKLKSEIEVPSPIDLTASKKAQEEAAKAQYDKLKPLVERDLRQVTAGLDKIEITEKTKDGKTETLFAYDLGEFKNSKVVKEAIDAATDYIARNAREWTPDMAQKAIEGIVADLRKDYIAANLTQIVKAHKDELTKKFMDEKFEKENNSRPLNPDLNNPNMTEEQKKAKSAKDKFKQDVGLTGRKFYAS